MPPILPPANSNNARPPPPSGNILLDLHWVRFKILSVIMPQLDFGIKDGKLNCYCPFYNKSCQIAMSLHVLQLISCMQYMYSVSQSLLLIIRGYTAVLAGRLVYHSFPRQLQAVEFSSCRFPPVVTSRAIREPVRGTSPRTLHLFT